MGNSKTQHDNSLKMNYYLSFGRNYRIYFMFFLTLTCKFENLHVSPKYTHQMCGNIKRKREIRLSQRGKNLDMEIF